MISTRSRLLASLAAFTVIATQSLSIWADRPDRDEAKNNEEPAAERSSAPRPPQVNRPQFNNLRFEENWSVFKDGVLADPRDRIKFIPLDESAAIFVSLGGQLRLRGETWSGFGFGRAGGTGGGTGDRDDSFGLLRLRLHTDWHFGDHARLFVEGKSALATGRTLPGGLRTLEVDSADFQNAFLDLKAGGPETAVTFRVGRQELQFGRQRLISPLDWSNTRRAWDGGRVILRTHGWRVDGFWTRFVRIDKYDLNASDDSGIEFFGIYGAGKWPNPSFGLDIYWIGIDRRTATFGEVAAREKRHTIGARTGGSLSGGLDVDLEGAFQFGDHGNRDIQAAMFASEIGYRFSNVRVQPRIYLGFDWASGDDDPADGHVETFNHLFPLGHAYFGHIDLVARQNVLDLSHGLSLSPTARFNLGLAGHSFWRDSRRDALYNAGGGVVRSGGTARHIGYEVDLTAAFQVTRHARVSGGYGHLFPGAFVSQTGPDQGVDFAYLILQYTF